MNKHETSSPRTSMNFKGSALVRAPPRRACHPSAAIPPRVLGPLPPTSRSRQSVCPICSRAMEISFSERDSWKSYHQPLGLEMNGSDLVPPQRHPYNAQVSVHSCCWELAKNVLNRPTLDQHWLISFTSHLLILRPFVKMTPFDCETHDVDHELSAEIHLSVNSRLENQEQYRGIFPPSLFEDISQLLSQNPEIVRLDDVNEIDPCLAYCVSKGVPYSLTCDTNSNVRQHLQMSLEICSRAIQRDFPKPTTLEPHGTTSRTR